ncbi:hypothetical protein Moror_1574 [Moniliophthora roreri MCA 2997]|uniref:T6SS Phospholipase effector Tle1-like catalytic domain-containing protein n=1 Tax=Moniliophthora roreri (strain MCA 2997) TaxID=1381753 RepID=V2X351_MONRO|nr:hypothetical protein Moror_1574 [Moniliophthora roreri MCA 2997]KAI3611028.1 hypothetical protein WG66_013807 [Moniliophthora roreri]
MANPKLWTKFDSTDIEDAAEMGRLHSMRPHMPQQRHCNCVHDALPHTPGARPSRNLVVCIDGTANQFSDKNTNVVELYSRLEKSEHLQVTFYNSGIGTYASPSWKSLTYYRQVIYHKIDLAVAWRFEKILLSAYRWLCEQYQTGDRIFLFGFSRGAYQVRALSAMIEKVGLIHRGNEAQIPFAYDLYQKTAEHSACESDTKAKFGFGKKKDSKEKDSEKIKSQVPPEDTPKHEDQSLSNEKKISESGPQANKSEHAGPKAVAGESSKPEKQKPNDYTDNAARFKRTFCRTDAKVHFVGVWDTVSSVGFAKKKELPLTTEGMGHVCLFRHALALDERRVKFLPEFVNGGTGPKIDDQKKSGSEMPHTKEVWFSGTHSDIGGGNIENKGLNNNGPALRWMITEASKAGLLLTPFSWKWDEVRTAKAFNESLTGFWRVLEILPIKRSLYEVQDKTTRRPHMGGRRKILEGQLVHRSVYGSDRLHIEYKDELKSWNGKDLSKIEPDKLDQVTHHIEYAIDLLSNMDMKASGQRYHHLSHLNHTSFMFGTDEAIQAYINLSHALFYPVNLDDPVNQRRTVATMEVLENLASNLFQKQHFSRQPPVIRNLLRSDASKQADIRTCIERFLNAFGTAEIFSIRRNGPVSSFAFSPDSKQIACGTASGDIFLRDAITGAELQTNWKTTIYRHGNRVSCLAFSQDGKKVVSGGHDRLIRTWDAETGVSLGDFYDKGLGKISSVSYAWDGRIVVASESNDVFLLRSDLSAFTMLMGHSYDVLSASFSPKVPTSVAFGLKNSSGAPSSIPQAAPGPDSTHGSSNQPANTLNTSGGHGASNQNQPATTSDPINDTGVKTQPCKVDSGTSDGLPDSPAPGGVDQSAKDDSPDSKPYNVMSAVTSKIASMMGSVRNSPEGTGSRISMNKDDTPSSPTQQKADQGAAGGKLNAPATSQKDEVPGHVEKTPDISPAQKADQGAVDSKMNAPATSQKDEVPGHVEKTPGIEHKTPVQAPSMPQNTDSSTPTGLPPSSLPGPATVQSMVTQVVSTSRDRTFCVWNVGAEATVPSAHQSKDANPAAEQAEPVTLSFKSFAQDELRCAAFSNDGQKVLVGSRDGLVSMWSPNPAPGFHNCSWLASVSKSVSSSWPGGERVAVNCLAVAPPPPPSSDPKTPAPLTESGPPSQSQPPFPFPTKIRLACGLDDGRVTLWDLSSGMPQFEREYQHSSSVVSVSYSPDGKRIAACTKEGIVIVWDAQGPSGECILEQLTNNDRWFP